MFIQKIQLSNFKRFTQLHIDLSYVEPSPKLVLLIGANGSGKSSIFDAFGLFPRTDKLDLQEGLETPGYYKKIRQQDLEVEIKFSDGHQLRQVNGHYTADRENQTVFYGRSAFRQLSRLQRIGRGRLVDMASDEDRPQLFIDRDQRFENDIDSITQNLVAEIFAEEEYNTKAIRDKYVTPINDAFGRIFGTQPATSLSLILVTPSLHNEPADIRFRKGKSEIHYDLLSSGEKEVFNILLNLHNRREFYNDSIYIIDELDVHLNTALQYTLLQEITEYWLPNGCQLWTASHSLGFIQYAQQAEYAVILDFDQYDFDEPRHMVPEPKDSREVYNIAVPQESLSILFYDRQIIFCENQDVEFYNLLGLQDKIFVPARDKNDVYYRAKNNPDNFGLMDRDYLTNNELGSIRRSLPNLYILQYYSIESYLYHPENLAELIPDFDQDGYTLELHQQLTIVRDEIVYGLQNARNGYRVLKEVKGAEEPDATRRIFDATASPAFEDFYPYLDMKSKVDRSALSRYNFSKRKLASTRWFRAKIEGLF